MKNKIQPYTADFFEQDTVHVAKALLGSQLIRQGDEFPEPLQFTIIETEAYTQNDPACHAFKGNKGRGATLYMRPGLAYVYFIYGMYHCLNVVTEAEGKAGAVLFRALSHTPYPAKANSGPGKLCKNLHITKAQHNHIDMTDATSELLICPGITLQDKDIVTTTRIGISQAKDYPWRFYIKDHPDVSRK